MKNLYKFLLIILFIFLNKVAHSETTVAYIDMQTIILQSDAGQKIKKRLEETHKQNLIEFKETETNLKEEEKKILSQKNILKEDEFKIKITELRKKANNYNLKRKLKIESLHKLKTDSTNAILNKLNPILAEYSIENSIALIIQKKVVVIGKKDLDITNEVLNIFNSKVKDIELK